jgi:hypothetical protein
MSLSLLPTLEEVRNAVGTRVGLRNSGKLQAGNQAILDEEIRSAQRELFVSYHWLRRNVEVRLTLSVGVKVYDLPNVLNLNGIQRVGVLESDGIKVTSLTYDDLQDISNTYKDNGKPRFWKVMGSQVDASPAASPTISAAIVINPPPDADWPTLVIEGQMRDYPPTLDADRIVVDGEAVIRAVTIRMKEYLGIGGSQNQARSDLATYVNGLRGVEAPSRAYAIASRKVDGPAYWDRPSTAAGHAPYSTDWTPW